ncbi:MAG: hypothetical protein PVI09_20635, partial [Anaerolineae bacterium]
NKGVSYEAACLSGLTSFQAADLWAGSTMACDSESGVWGGGPYLALRLPDAQEGIVSMKGVLDE